MIEKPAEQTPGETSDEAADHGVDQRAWFAVTGVRHQVLLVVAVGDERPPE